MDHSEQEMTIENLKQKVELQSGLIKELKKENEELFHQYNHLIIRNGKMLKRTDDYQKIINDLHLRIEELQLINGNMMQLNDRFRKRGDFTFTLKDNIGHGKMKPGSEISSGIVESGFDMDDLFNRWKKFPGQVAQNEPNLRKQVLMMVHLYSTSSLRAAELFNLSGVGGVTGARYVSALKKFDMIRFSGARKKGHYEITSKGFDFVKNSIPEKDSEKETNDVAF